ncbi:hypothetical protein CH267_00450 [Rhodococcus sp. 06-621-2]|nr:hypothetical protein CH267_00450 [Rhodococcus sp. 06-621-2]
MFPCFKVEPRHRRRRRLFTYSGRRDLQRPQCARCAGHRNVGAGRAGERQELRKRHRTRRTHLRRGRPRRRPRHGQCQREQWAEGSAAEQSYSFEETLAWASYGEDVVPGEFIATRTVGGGCGLEQNRWIQPGDLVELTATGIGTLANRVGGRESVPDTASFRTFPFTIRSDITGTRRCLYVHADAAKIGFTDDDTAHNGKRILLKP